MYTTENSIGFTFFGKKLHKSLSYPVKKSQNLYLAIVSGNLKKFKKGIYSTKNGGGEITHVFVIRDP
jgi:hypothetical protein